MWWERLVKKKIRHFYKQEEMERNRDYVILENHYYECIYDIIAQNSPHEEKLPRLNRLKASTVKMQSARLQTMTLDTQETDRMDDEHPTIYHISQIKKGVHNEPYDRYLTTKAASTGTR